MKKLLLIFSLFSMMTLNACSSNNDNPADQKNKDYKEGVVNYMSVEMFRQMIWDYNANPEKWVFKGDLPCIIDFYADWCRPCRMVAPIMEDLAKEYKGKIRIYKVNTDNEKELASKFRISSIPAVMFIPKDGQPQMAVGAQPKDAYLKVISDLLKVK
jgi:thioredoxin 1